MAYFFIGMMIGLLVGVGISCFRSDGSLLVYDVDERKTIWTLQLKTDPEEARKKRSICLRVRVSK